MVDYIDKVQYAGQEPQYIESECFQGKWVYKYLSLASNATAPPDTWSKYSLSNYLPDDGHDYEVLATLESNTGTAANNSVFWWVRSGDSNWISCRPCAVRTCTASAEKCAGAVIIPIRANDKIIGSYLESGAQTSGSYWFRCYGYRKLGINNWNDNNLHNTIKFDNKELQFGGVATTGKWQPKSVTLLSNYVISAQVDNVPGEVTVDLKSHLPQDNYDYECIIDGTSTTSSTNGQSVVLRAWLYDINDKFQICANIVRSGATKVSYFNYRIPVRRSQDNLIKIINTGTSTSTTNLRLRAIRRLGVYE